MVLSIPSVKSCYDVFWSNKQAQFNSPVTILLPTKYQVIAVLYTHNTRKIVA